MKKILLLIIVSLVFMSCDMSVYNVADHIRNDKYQQRITKSELYYDDYSSIKEYSDITPYLREHIEYRDEYVDVWATAKETLTRGYGDCEDIAIAYMNILYIQFKVKGELIAVYSRAIEGGGLVNHAMVRFPSGEIIDAYTGYYYAYPVGYSYSFDYFFYTL